MTFSTNERVILYFLRQACSRDGNKKDGGSSCRSDSGLGTAETDMEDTLGEVMEPCLWLCMQCGHQVQRRG